MRSICVKEPRIGKQRKVLIREASSFFFLGPIREWPLREEPGHFSSDSKDGHSSRVNSYKIRKPDEEACVLETKEASDDELRPSTRKQWP